MKTVLESDVLIAKGKKGNKYWQGFVKSIDGELYHTTSAWHDTADGVSKAVHSEPYKIEQKNVGRANETTLQEQAKLEFDAIVKKQQEKGYLPEGVEYEGYPLPMLAQKYEERKHKLQWPVYVQPKLNGMRMLTDGIIAWSRGGKQILPEVVQHILPGKKLPYIMDGELILPNNVLLQETMSAAKKYREGISDKLQYHVYDCIDSQATFRHRTVEVMKQFSKFGNAVLVETVECANEAAVKACHKRFTKAGYEGTIIRDASEPYAINQRSNQLQKYKDFVDAEFKIIAVEDGGGSDAGCAILICDVGNGEVVRCKPEGKKSYAKELYNQREELIGKWLTIRYQELSELGIPIFPVGVSIREKGDF